MKPATGVIAVFLLTACVATPGVEERAPGERAALDTDEAGLRMLADHWEAELRSSGAIVSDPELNAYVREVTCRVAQEYCNDIRVYVLEVPDFNAFMTPNGMMGVWTGLLLRAQNEAQLAAVLGHEIAHYRLRHVLTGWRDVRNKTALYTYGQILLYGAGVQGASAIDLAGQIALVGTIFQFSRTHEREADQLGLELMTEAGYDPAEAAAVWEGLIEEMEVEETSPPPLFLSTHPEPEERVASLNRLAAERRTEANTGVTERERYVSQLLPLRGAFLEDELAQRRFASTRLILDRLRKTDTAPGQIEFFLGELYRLRGAEQDAEQALAHYRIAVTLEGAPPEAYRSLGIVSRRMGNHADARAAFRRYLELRPGAEDRTVIEAYVAMRP
jgi:hypothetical protein